jgi:hypothetical protein
MGLSAKENEVGSNDPLLLLRHPNEYDAETRRGTLRVTATGAERRFTVEGGFLQVVDDQGAS